ncbi:MAG: dienelactone hydrolase family protein [Actinomycetota bacterium]
MTIPPDTGRALLLCPACGAELGYSERDDARTLVCRTCGTHVLRRADHGHFVFDHREVTDVTAEGSVRHLRNERVDIATDGVDLSGTLCVPEAPYGLVIFAHGIGSSRLSPRNMAVASGLNRVGLATLLFDLLSEEEVSDRRSVFDVPLLGGRLSVVTKWAERRAATRGIPVGYFGASTGSAAALWAAAEPSADVRAVVSRGGRPDLVDARLERVTAPTLLIVGGHDEQVLALNREAVGRMRCEHRIEVIPGATHLFEESGALERVGHLAAAWFLRCLPRHEAFSEGGRATR